MKIGISIGYGTANFQVPLKRILRAEELGYDSVWASETYSTDAFTPLAYIAAHTKKIRLGTGIAAISARSPAATAMTAMTIDAMAGGGRMIVGLGTSGPQIVEGWHGQPWGKPNTRLRDYLAIMKKVFRREGPVAHDGKEIQLPYVGPGSSGMGKPLKSILPAANVPIYLGTDTELNVRMTAEVADGWLSQHFVPGDMKYWGPIIEEGLAKRTDGKTLKSFELRGAVHVRINPDVRAALASFKPAIALYVGGMGAKGKNFHKDAMIRHGFKDAAERIQELFLAGRKDEAAAAVPDEHVDNEALVGPPGRIRERWKLWLDSGLTSLAILSPDDQSMELIGTMPR